MSAYEYARKNLSNNLRMLVAAEEKSIKSLFECAGIDRKLAHTIISRNRDVRLSSIAKISELFGVSCADMLSVHDENWGNRVIMASRTPGKVA